MNYIDCFDIGGEVGKSVFKRFWSNTKDTFNIPNPSIIGGSYQTAKEIYKQNKNESKETNTKTFQIPANLIGFLHNNHVVRISDGNWAIVANSTNRNSNISSSVQ